MDKIISTTKQELNKFLVIATLLSIAFGQLTRLEIGDLPAFFVHDVLVFTFVVLNLGKLNKISKDKLIRPFALLIALNLLAHALSNTLTSIGILYLFRLIIYFTFYLFIRNVRISFRKTAAMLLAGTITLIIAYAQYFLLPDTRYLAYLGWDDHLNRIIFPHFDPTYTAIALGLFFLLTIDRNRKFLSILTLPAILLTYSRSTFISLAFVLALKYKRLIPYVLAALLVIPLLPRRFGEGTNLLRTYSISNRVDHDLAILDLGLENPLLGVGFNNVAYHLYGGFDRHNHATSANNSIVQIFATSGILGSIIFLRISYLIYKKSKYKPSLLFLAVSSLFNNTAFYPFSLLWIIILDGLKVSKKDLD